MDFELDLRKKTHYASSSITVRRTFQCHVIFMRIRENLMSNNFRKTAFLKKNINCKLKLQSKGLYLNILGAYLYLNFSRGLL